MELMWSTIGALFILAIGGMLALLGQEDQTLSFGQWLVTLLWLAWALFGVAFVWTSAIEREWRAVKVGTVLFGGIAASIAVILVNSWIF
jgi:hypothetical protein